MSDHLPKNVRKTLDKLKKHSTEKERRLLDELDRQLAYMVPADSPKEMRVESMVASKTGNPMVTFIWGSNKGELSPIAARGYALQIIESCEAATQDAALLRGLRSIGQNDQNAFALIDLVRKNRRHFEGGE